MNYLKYARILGEFDAKKLLFDLKSFRSTKINKYKFLKRYKGVLVNQYDFCLPEQKLPKIVGHFNTIQKTILLPINGLLNTFNETVNFPKKI